MTDSRTLEERLYFEEEKVRIMEQIQRETLFYGIWRGRVETLGCFILVIIVFFWHAPMLYVPLLIFTAGCLRNAWIHYDDKRELEQKLKALMSRTE